MPLVIPGMQSKDGKGQDMTTEWLNKLTGKKLGEQSSETTFAKKELPPQHRVVKEGDMMTADHNPERYVKIDEVDVDVGTRLLTGLPRLNIHTGNDGTVTKVTHG